MKLLAYPTVLTVRFKEIIGIYLGNKCFSSHFSQNFQVKTTGKGEALVFLYCVFKCVIHAILFYQIFFFHLLMQIVLHLYITYFIYLLYMIKKFGAFMKSVVTEIYVFCLLYCYQWPFLEGKRKMRSGKKRIKIHFIEFIQGKSVWKYVYLIGKIQSICSQFYNSLKCSSFIVIKLWHWKEYQTQ